MLRRHVLALLTPLAGMAVHAQESTPFAVRGVSDDPALLRRYRQGEPIGAASFLTRDRYGHEWLAFDPAYLNAKHIASSSAVTNQADRAAGEPVALRIALTPEGQNQMAEASRAWLGRSLGVFVASRLIVVATVREEISTHSLELSLPEFSPQQVEELVRAIKKAGS